MAQLTCENVSLGYDNKTILSNLSFSVNSGDYLCIVGENGSGKSTLMRTMLGLQKPMSGEISLGDGLKKGEIGYLPQQTDVQKNFPASVKEIVLSGCQARAGLRPFYNNQEKEMAANAMKKMRIEEFSKRCYRELSGGQQQRVSIARALLTKPAIVLADEPTGNLDSVTSMEVVGLLKSCAARFHQTTLIVTHQEEVAQMADRVIRMSDGKIYTRDCNDC